MKINYIQCMDFTFEDVEVLGINTFDELCKKIENGEMIPVKCYENSKRVDYINPDYIMYFGQEEEK